MGLSDVFQAIQKKVTFSKEVEISGVKFVLGLLTFEQEMKTEAVPQENMDPLVYYNETRRYTLSHAIKSVDGEVVPDIVEVKTGDKIEKVQGVIYLRGFISTLPVKMVEQLFDAYIDIKDEFEGMLDKELKYTWFKTPEQRDAERKDRSSGDKEPEEGPETSEDSSESKPIKLVEIPKPSEDEKK